MHSTKGILLQDEFRKPLCLAAYVADLKRLCSVVTKQHASSRLLHNTNNFQNYDGEE